MAILHLIAGPNGAGKSTLYDYLIAPRHPALEFVNADIHECEQLSHITNPVERSEAARTWADARRASLLRRGTSFISETVFSHPSKLDLIGTAQKRGFSVVLYVVCVDEPRLLLQRVRRRVGEGGHHVPPHKILERYPRTLSHLAQAVKLANMSMLFDAQEVSIGGPRLLAVCSGADVELHASPLPRWAADMLGNSGK